MLYLPYLPYLPYFPYLHQNYAIHTILGSFELLLLARLRHPAGGGWPSERASRSSERKPTRVALRIDGPAKQVEVSKLEGLGLRRTTHRPFCRATAVTPCSTW